MDMSNIIENTDEKIKIINQYNEVEEIDKDSVILTLNDGYQNTWSNIINFFNSYKKVQNYAERMWGM